MSDRSTDDIRPTVRSLVVRSRAGDVVHVHQEFTFGGEMPDDETPDRRALRLAGAHGQGGRVEEVASDALPRPEFREPAP